MAGKERKIGYSGVTWGYIGEVTFSEQILLDPNFGELDNVACLGRSGEIPCAGHEHDDLQSV